MAGLLPVAASAAVKINKIKLLKAASDHFEFYTTGGDATAKASLERFESARAYLLKATNSQDPFTIPVRMFAFRSHGEFSSSLPKGVSADGAYSKGGDSSAFILIDGLGKDADERGMKEYVSLLFERVAPKMPFWLRLGLGQMYSTLRTQNGSMVIGEPPHVAYRAGSSPTLTSSVMSLLMDLKPGDVKGQNKQAAAYNTQNNADVTTVDSAGNKVDLLARPGGLPTAAGLDTIADEITMDYPLITLHMVRMLMFNQTYSAKFGSLVSELAEGQKSANSFNKVYGQSMTGLAQDLAMDWNQRRAPIMRVKFEPPKVDPRVGQLSADDSAATMAGIKNAR